MAGTTFDLDDLRAAENRRKEAAVRAGASPRAERYAMSPIKELMVEYDKRNHSPEEEKLQEYLNEHPIPGYNMTTEDPKDRDRSEKAQEDLNKLLEEANENEWDVTDTSTGLPKVKPVLTEEEQKELEVAKKAKAARIAAEKGIPAKLAVPTQGSTEHKPAGQTGTADKK